MIHYFPLDNLPDGQKNKKTGQDTGYGVNHDGITEGGAWISTTKLFAEVLRYYHEYDFGTYAREAVNHGSGPDSDVATGEEALVPSYPTSAAQDPTPYVVSGSAAVTEEPLEPEYVEGAEASDHDADVENVTNNIREVAFFTDFDDLNINNEEIKNFYKGDSKEYSDYLNDNGMMSEFVGSTFYTNLSKQALDVNSDEYKAGLLTAFYNYCETKKDLLILEEGGLP
jgi:hypothetical protein